jgi:hypothetical protein
MDWESIGIGELKQIVDEELAKASSEEKALFARTAVPPSKWQLSGAGWTDENLAIRLVVNKL